MLMFSIEIKIQKTEKTMAEENPPDTQNPTSDDVDALRALLYKVKGISVVSSVPYEEIPGEQLQE